MPTKCRRPRHWHASAAFTCKRSFGLQAQHWPASAALACKRSIAMQAQHLPARARRHRYSPSLHYTLSYLRYSLSSLRYTLSSLRYSLSSPHPNRNYQTSWGYSNHRGHERHQIRKGAKSQDPLPRESGRGQGRGEGGVVIKACHQPNPQNPKVNHP